ncbi:MAG: diguanylate cyclase [Lachnospiraceae bacterium]|nr:diguanylate cyclase [Lachnospiraceae bacterium]
MNSIKTKITMLTVCAAIISAGIAAAIGVISIRNIGRSDADKMLLLLCRTGEYHLDSYFESVEQSVETVAGLVQEGLEGVPYEQLGNQVERSRSLFGNAALQTAGVLTYYFRVDPEVTDTTKGFWYTNLDGRGFTEHEVTDISLYDTNDVTRLVWFTVPKATGKAIWLPPYITDNLDVRVISYNVPIYWDGRFLGVIGIEIDYETVVREVSDIRLYDHGYAFITDDKGKLIYHPYLDVSGQKENREEAPEGLIDEETYIHYTYRNQQKLGVWLPLSNGMRLFVAVPSAELNNEWLRMIREVLAVSTFVLLVVSILAMRYADHLTKPLLELTAAAEQVDRGNYDLVLHYGRKDEVGALTGTFKRLVEHLREHISDLNERVYIDALTSVRNKGAYADAIQELQDQRDLPGEEPVFGVGVFDCDNLKTINDRYGHDKGDEYLKAASGLICRVFSRSPVYRIGGDEFAVILEGEDYENREELLRQFEEAQKEICKKAENEWQKVSVTAGIAVFDPEQDLYVIDTMRRADKMMYHNKRLRKTLRGCEGNE